MSRQQLLDKIQQYEQNGWFDRDINDDPETIVLMPDQVDYLKTKLSTRVKSAIANFVAVRFYERLIRKGQLIIKDIVGLDNLQAVVDKKCGAILTCNHFSPYDNYAIYRPLRKMGHKRFFKVIREGNYTNFGGIYGYFFRHCNTLPLSSNKDTMKNFFKACDTLLARGEYILMYPEQSMWFNYRKPKPLKSGAYRIAVRANVPIVPCFITMNDSKTMDSEGYPLQEYTLHYLPAIYPDSNLTDKENSANMMSANSKAWQEVYESVYNVPLTYITKEQ